MKTIFPTNIWIENAPPISLTRKQARSIAPATPAQTESEHRHGDHKAPASHSSDGPGALRKVEP